MPLGATLSEDVPVVEFVYLVFTSTPGGVTVGDSGLVVVSLASVSYTHLTLPTRPLV